MVLARAGLHQHLSLPEAAVVAPVGTRSAADNALPEGGVWPIQPHGSSRLASVHLDTGLRHPHPSISHKAVPAIHVPVTPLLFLCVLCASEGLVQLGIILAGVKTVVGIWGARGPAFQVQPIGTGASEVSVTWKATV